VVTKVQGREQKRKSRPQRSCVGCGEVRDKGDLVRIVRTPEGAVIVDETGKKSGRGAYLHRKRDCWEIGLKKSRLNRTLRVQIGEEYVEQLWRYTRSLSSEG
jgi:predicted RNA-binding protein YlxR (DUF448 family)